MARLMALLMGIVAVATSGCARRAPPIELPPPPTPPLPPPPVESPAPPPLTSGAPATRPPRVVGSYDLVPVFFGTNRAMLAAGQAGFANAPGASVRYGTVLVSVPTGREIGTLPVAPEWSRDPDARPGSHFTVRRLDLTDRDGVFSAASGDMDLRNVGGGGRAALLFVHGFNVSFREAAFRSAQIVHDTGFAGSALLYSWPSAHDVLGYGRDEARVKASEPAIGAFIADILDRAKPDRLFIVAHSMGTRGATRALRDLASPRPDLAGRVSALILAAPDIDKREFETTIAPGLTAIAPNVTTYVSRSDRALVASQLYRCRLRHLWQLRFGQPCAASLGDGRDPFVAPPPLVAIDVSDTSTDWLGHSTFAQSPALLDDIAAVLAAQAPAARPWLVPSGNHYVYRRVPELVP